MVIEGDVCGCGVMGADGGDNDGESCLVLFPEQCIQTRKNTEMENNE
jgi:hypothetical protein